MSVNPYTLLPTEVLAANAFPMSPQFQQVFSAGEAMAAPRDIDPQADRQMQYQTEGKLKCR